MRPKVFLAAREASCDLSPLLVGAEPLCDVWAVDISPAQQHAKLRLRTAAAEPTGEGVPVLQPPATVCLLAAQSLAARQDLEAFRRWWAAHSPTPAPAVESWDGPASTVV